MGFWGDVFGGAVNGAVSSAATSSFEALCNQNGWGIDARNGENGYELHFNHREIGPLKVVINYSSRLGIFSLASSAEFRVRDLTPEIGYGLLMRNRDAAFASWHMRDLGQGRYGFVATFSTFTGGIDAQALKVICQKLCEEVVEVDSNFRAKGLI